MTIELYNESNVDSRAIHLTNSVGTINTMVGVEFSHPSGIFRLNQFTNATHFKATFAGVEYIYKITGFSAINNGVCEYSYTLDFLKDYFNKHTIAQFKNLKAIVTRGTLESEWTKYADDSSNCFMDGSTSKEVITLTQTFNQANGCFILKQRSAGPAPTTSSPVRVYAMTGTQYHALCNTLLDTNGYYHYENGGHTPTLDAMKRVMALNQIDSIYYCPVSLTGYSDSIIWSGKIGADSADTFSIDNVNGHSFNVYNNNDLIISVPIFYTQLVDDFRDLYLTNYIMSIPFFGSYQINPIKFFDITTNAIRVGVKFLINPIDSTISFSWIYAGHSSNNIIDTRPLPEVPVPSSAMATAMLNQRMTYANNISAINASVKLSGLSGFGSSNYYQSGINAGLAGMSANINKQEALRTNVRAMAMAEATNSLYGGSTSGFSGYLITNGTVEKIKYNTTFEPTVYGYIINKNIANVSLENSNKYWIDVSTSSIGGQQWYADGVKADISNEYILIN